MSINTTPDEPDSHACHICGDPVAELGDALLCPECYEIGQALQQFANDYHFIAGQPDEQPETTETEPDP
jgi:hypothetical protein